MFIRTTKKEVKKNGKIYKYKEYRLVESVRTTEGPRQNTILNLGKLNIDESHLKLLANTIEAIINKQPLLFTDNPEIMGLAQHFTELIIRKRLQDKAQNVSDFDQEHITPQPSTPDYETVDINSATTTDNRSIALEHITVTQLNELGFFDILDACNFTKQQKNYAVAQICGRLIHPDSERETARWLRETSGLDELLGANFSRISDNTLHRTADLLLKNKDIIEQKLSQNTRSLYSLDDSLIFYDLTNTYFESSKRNSKIAKYGRSKEKRSDCPIVTLALVVDAMGFPKKSRIYKGNISEGETLFEILEEMVPWNNYDAPKTVIIDAGIATEKNLEKLRNDARFEYVAVSRKKVPHKLFDDVSAKELKVSKDKKLTIKAVRKEDETFVLCSSEQRAARDEDIFASKTMKFEKALAALRDGLQKKGTRKQYDYVFERIGRLKERFKIGQFYKIDVKREGEKAIDIKWKFLKNKPKSDGEYILRTSRIDLSDEQISVLHRTLTMIESSFRWLKMELGLRPNYHQLDSSMSSHIFISVLAYFVLAPLLNKLEWGGKLLGPERNATDNSNDKKMDDKNVANKINRINRINREKKNYDIVYGWKGVVGAMESQSRVTTSFLNRDNLRIDIRTTVEPTVKQYELYKRLNVSPRPLKRIIFKDK